VKGDHIAFVGRLERTKGLHVLLDALASLSQRRPDLNLQLKVAGGGDGSYAALLQQKVVDAELGDAVQFLGWLDVNELATLVRRSRLTVVPSLWYENLPNAILESLASGTPVLASDLGSMSECVIDGQTGYHFSAGEPESLAGTIEYCLDHPEELAAMSRQARRAAEDLYSAERHLNALEELFDELAHQQKDREGVRKSYAA
jgi:glycosyltransferase involved in cell wall biosynthesis